MKVLIACERSGTVRDAFIARGHDAVSCDIFPSDTPGPHHLGDVREILRDGWDLMIAHPECTYLTCAAEWAYGPGPYHQKVKPGTLTGEARKRAREEAIAFALDLWNAPIDRVCLENPVGVLSHHLGRPQVIQPYQFGDDASKKTCLYLKGLKPLRIDPALYVPPTLRRNGKSYWANQTDTGQNRLAPGENRAKDRSKTYPGIAAAIADQFGGDA